MKENKNIEDQSRNTNFGFKKVKLAEKKQLVADVFSKVSSKYDLMNDLMSLGVHRYWKNKLCLNIADINSTIIDVASGSGDIAFRIKKKAQLQNKTDNKVIICDINPEMLKLAKDKALDNNFLQGIEYLCADAENLPLAESSVDYYTIAFGIRNVSDINAALCEAYRVLKPGGKFLCLEFSSITSKNLKLFYDFYSFNIIPKIGKFIAGNEAAYDYLVESINLFPCQEEFKVMMIDAGFEQVFYENLSFGIAAIHTGYKL